MSSARENILRRLQQVTQGAQDGAVNERLNNPPELIRPALPENLQQRFGEKLELGGGRLERCDGLNQVESVIARYLDHKGTDKRLRVSPALEDSISFDTLTVSYGNTRGDDLVSVTPALCAIAETGSVVLVSDADRPTSLNFLPDLHIVIVREQQLLPHLEDAWTHIRRLDHIPRAINIITGPSKTADVEQTLQIGAHGPRELLVILVSNGIGQSV